MEWERWDRDASEPPEYPEGGEPEGYILDRPHDERTAEEMGPLWEVVLDVGARVIRWDESWNVVISVIGESLTGADVFRARRGGWRLR